MKTHFKGASGALAALGTRPPCTSFLSRGPGLGHHATPRDRAIRLVLLITVLFGGTASSVRAQADQGSPLEWLVPQAASLLSGLPASSFRIKQKLRGPEGKLEEIHYEFCQSGTRFYIKTLGPDKNTKLPLGIKSYDGQTYYILNSQGQMAVTSKLGTQAKAIANSLYMVPIYNPYYNLFQSKIDRFSLPDILSTSAWMDALKPTEISLLPPDGQGLRQFRQYAPLIHLDQTYHWKEGEAFPSQIDIITDFGKADPKASASDIKAQWKVERTLKLSNGAITATVPSKIVCQYVRIQTGEPEIGSYEIEIDESSVKYFPTPPSDDIFRVPSAMAKDIWDADLAMWIRKKPSANPVVNK